MTGHSGEPLTEAQQEVIEKVAKKIIRWSAAVPAIFALESMKPLSFVGSQFLIAIGPFAEIIFNPDEYQQFVLAMENRDNVEYLLQRIESLDMEARDAEKAARKRAKEIRKEKREAKRAKRLQAKAANEDN
ncbi:MAG: hypothetical protein JW941_09660 [Candidatus Coatesbacteria bacterium]|nr:hypothetical protein [Candidatus Coatesbacteria bacterium]